MRSLEKNYRHTTLAPFHFIPGKTLSCIQKQGGSGDAYRCIPGKEAEAVLIHQIMSDAVERVKMDKNENSLMQLGMALHTYADTYAHCGFSVRFPNHEMQQAFLYGGDKADGKTDRKYGLAALGYAYKELDDVSVEICFQ